MPWRYDAALHVSRGASRYSAPTTARHKRFYAEVEAEEEAKRLLELELEQLVEVEVKVVSGGEGDGWW